MNDLCNLINYEQYARDPEDGTQIKFWIHGHPGEELHIAMTSDPDATHTPEDRHKWVAIKLNYEQVSDYFAGMREADQRRRVELVAAQSTP